MPLYNPIKARKEFIDEVLNLYPMRNDVPLIFRPLWGNPRADELQAQALVGVRDDGDDKWHFWWYSLSGRMEKHEETI